MSAAASQASAFYREVARARKVWAIRDAAGFPTANGDGAQAMPFWSSRSRAERIIKSVPAYAAFESVEISWEVFVERWLPGLDKDGLKVGVNWTGQHAQGYDCTPAEVRRAVEFQMNPTTRGRYN